MSDQDTPPKRDGELFMSEAEWEKKRDAHLDGFIQSLALRAAMLRARDGQKRNLWDVAIALIPAEMQKAAVRGPIDKFAILSRLFTEARISVARIREGEKVRRSSDREILSEYFMTSLVSVRDKLSKETLFSKEALLPHLEGEALTGWLAKQSSPLMPIRLLDDEQLTAYVKAYDSSFVADVGERQDALIEALRLNGIADREALLQVCKTPEELRRIVTIAERMSSDATHQRESLFLRGREQVAKATDKLLAKKPRSEQEKKDLAMLLRNIRKSDVVVATIAAEVCGWREYTNLNFDQRYAGDKSVIQGITFADTTVILKEFSAEYEGEKRHLLLRAKPPAEIAFVAARNYLETEAVAKREFTYDESDPILQQAMDTRSAKDDRKLSTSIARTYALSIDENGKPHTEDRIRISDKICVLWHDKDGRQRSRVFSQRDLINTDSQLYAKTVDPEITQGDLHTHVLDVLIEQDYNVVGALYILRKEKINIDDKQLRWVIADVMTAPQIHVLSVDNPDRLTSSTAVEQMTNGLIDREKQKNPYCPATFGVFDNKWQIVLSGSFNHVIDDGVARSVEISELMKRLSSGLGYEERPGMFQKHNRIDLRGTSVTLDYLDQYEKITKSEKNLPVEGFTKIKYLYDACVTISDRIARMTDLPKTPLKSPSMVFQLIIGSFYNDYYSKISGDASIAEKPIGVLFANTDISKQLDLYPIQQALDIAHYFQLVKQDEEDQGNRSEKYLRNLVLSTQKALENSNMELVNKTKRSVPNAQVRKALNMVANVLKQGTGELSGETMLSCIPLPKNWETARRMPRRLRSSKPAKSENQKVCCTIGFAGLYQEESEANSEEMIISINMKSKNNHESVLMVDALQAGIRRAEDIAKMAMRKQ